MSTVLGRFELDRRNSTDASDEVPVLETGRPAIAAIAIAFTAATAIVLSVPLSAVLGRDYALAALSAVIAVSLAAVTGAVAAAAWWHALRRT